ncbi:MAG: hypothetical protein HFI19_11105 [Lachnospiraceae bacterium]|uniref:hypothetical protein n=1 Tax=Candidatus Merdisoma sp. JLR.KK006 TaxID=3112626 RepID=UPI002FF0317D|nr:hypothetical protein [Lachnospiraceae bacterium]
MSMEIRKNYVNPLTMMNTNRNQKLRLASAGTRDQAGKIKELQSKQQQLQNTLLLMKSTGSDSSKMSPENQKALEEKLEEISRELKSAKSELPKPEEESTSLSSLSPRKDIYEKTSSVKVYPTGTP